MVRRSLKNYPADRFFVRCFGKREQKMRSFFVKDAIFVGYPSWNRVLSKSHIRFFSNLPATDSGVQFVRIDTCYTQDLSAR
jgi:hypothetical protein